MLYQRERPSIQVTEQVNWLELTLSARQLREKKYHKERSKHPPKPPDVKILTADRWWNPYWRLYSYIRTLDLKGKPALVLGCGFGKDAILLSDLGAEVYACDLSPEMLEAARSNAGRRLIHFDEMAAERLFYADGIFSLVIAVDILHHTDVAQTLKEIRRVSQPGALFIFSEVYRHTLVSRMRKSRLGRWAYARLYRWVCETDSPYVTEDERPLNEQDIRSICSLLAGAHPQYCNFLVGQLFPELPLVSKVDTVLLRAVPGLGYLASCRCMSHGVMK